MKPIKIHCPSSIFDTTISLDGSKSISNRLIIINALSSNKGELNNCSTSEDTNILLQQLNKYKSAPDGTTYDIGHAGTSFRFLTSYFSRQSGTQILTGSDRMKQRPIGPLVEALKTLGADIDYTEKDGYPPLIIRPSQKEWKSHIEINASISSQFITSLLLIAPTLSNGLTISLVGKQVSTPYIKMTTDIMGQCGALVSWNKNDIVVKASNYKLTNYDVESDWSAASYYYGIAALSEKSNIKLLGLYDNSMQADQAIAKISEQFGITTLYEADGIRIFKDEVILPPHFEYDFLKCPDIAQTVMTIVAGLGIHGLYTGLETLKIKETDRFAAMKTELGKLGVALMQLPDKFASVTKVDYYMSEGKTVVDDVPRFDSYNDHRMAMSLSILGVIFDIEMNDPSVVEKSYRNYWKDIENLGFDIDNIEE